MEYEVPHKSEFDKAEKSNMQKKFCSYAIIVVSIVSIFLDISNMKIDWLNNVIQITAMILSFLLLCTKWKYTVVYRKAEKIRRDGFLDNAFGTKIADTESRGYYDTDEVQSGVRKMLSNLHENSFHSARICDDMIKSSELKLGAAFVGMLIIIGMNLINTKFVVALAALFLTSDIILDFLELKTLGKEIENVQEECKYIWENYGEKYHNVDNRTMARILRAYVHYETALAYASIMLDKKLFNKIKEQSLVAWKVLENRYNM